LYISLGVDTIIALSKFTASFFTKSSSMIAEGIHSVIDAVSQLLLIWGVKTSKRKPDEERPFGYGRDLYFWSFIVSLVIFSVGGCISIYEGILNLKKKELEGSAGWSYTVLAIAFAFNLISMFSALKAFKKQRKQEGFWKSVFRTKDPPTIIVLLGDLGDLVGLVIAFFGIYLSRLYHRTYYDAIASIIIGSVLVVISAILIKVSQGLLVGTSTSHKTLVRVVRLAEEDEAVEKIKKHFSTYLSPDEILLQLNAVFKKDLTTPEITDAITRITKKIQKEFPNMKQIFVTPVTK
jgi:cation diffusion facilitator family transporter